MFLAKAQGVEEGAPETLVLVKSLQSKDEQQQLDFRREVEMFGKLNHANVVRLLGLCREAEPHYMVLEYVDLVCPGVPRGTGPEPWAPQGSWLLLVADRARLPLLAWPASRPSLSALPLSIFCSFHLLSFWRSVLHSGPSLYPTRLPFRSCQLVFFALFLLSASGLATT